MRARRVYPRVCGGTEIPSGVGKSLKGLSPRVRGNPSGRRSSSLRQGSIPACAGEPPSLSDRECMMRVYPRVCGGTSIRSRRAAREAGLSPRVRGNQLALLWGESASGSIPACAGEPRATRSSSWMIRVYPRVCGGTPCRMTDLEHDVGLSPRVRGNLCQIFDKGAALFSI